MIEIGHEDQDVGVDDGGKVKDVSQEVPVGESQIGSRSLVDSIPAKNLRSAAKPDTKFLPFLKGMMDVGLTEKELVLLSNRLEAAGFSDPYQTAMILRYGLAEKMREFLSDTAQQNKLIALYQQAYVKSLPPGAKPRY